MPRISIIRIGNVAGSDFSREDDIRVARWAYRHWPCGRVDTGVRVRRRWKCEPDGDPRDKRSWAMEHWFEWTRTETDYEDA